MNPFSEHPLIVETPDFGAFLVDHFLKKYPDIVAALNAVDAQVRVIELPRESSGAPHNPQAALLQCRQALAASERKAAQHPGVTFFVFQVYDTRLFRAPKSKGTPPPPLKASRGAFAGFVLPGEGGAVYISPDWQIFHNERGWEAARSVVQGCLAALASTAAARPQIAEPPTEAPRRPWWRFWG